VALVPSGVSRVAGLELKVCVCCVRWLRCIDDESLHMCDFRPIISHKSDSVKFI
jgi:hypothetical protein